jgi:hypothetical protein
MSKSSAPIDASTLTRNGSFFRILDLDFAIYLGFGAWDFGVRPCASLGLHRNESRFQRWNFEASIPGALPQARMNLRRWR